LQKTNVVLTTEVEVAVRVVLHVVLEEGVEATEAVMGNKTPMGIVTVMVSSLNITLRVHRLIIDLHILI
jgi:hypothetical protein